MCCKGPHRERRADHRAADIVLTQTWGQGGARDIRGNRTKYDFRSARLRLDFQSDGTVTGMLGGYRPVFDVIQSPAHWRGRLGAGRRDRLRVKLAHSAIDADGIRDPRTGKCSGVSSAMRIRAVPAFVNDLPNAARISAR